MVRTAFYWGVLGLFAGPALFYLLILIVLYTDADCQAGTPGRCTLDIGLNLVIGAVAGFALFFAVSLVRALMARGRAG